MFCSCTFTEIDLSVYAKLVGDQSDKQWVYQNQYLLNLIYINPDLYQNITKAKCFVFAVKIYILCGTLYPKRTFISHLGDWYNLFKNIACLVSFCQAHIWCKHAGLHKSLMNWKYLHLSIIITRFFSLLR